MDKPACSIDGCTRVAFRRGLCNPDYRIALGKVCTECGAPAVANGLCSIHHTRKLRHGDVHTVTFIRGDDEARFWSHVDRRADTECWPWTAHTDSQGYGVFKVGGDNKRAHRWAYDRFVEPVPAHLTIDHVWARGCTMKRCVNFVAHMDVVPIEVNVIRGNGACALNARKTHCKRGHPFSPSNTLIRTDGSRYCRTCKALREQGRLVPARSATG